MNKQAILCLSAALGPALLAASLSGDKIEFRAAEGLSLRRDFTSVHHLTLDDMEISQNGQPLPMEIQMDMEMDMRLNIGITDEYVSMGTERPAKLVRSFDELGQQSEFSMKSDQIPGGNQDKSIGAESELEGKKVVFAWDADSSAYRTSFDSGEGDESLLEGLEEDMDLRFLLPGKEVAEGDTWEVDVKKLRLLLSPGGDLKLKPSEEDMGGMGGMQGMDSMSDFSSMFDDLVQGTATAEYRGQRDIDGVSCGVILLKLDISASADLTEQIGAMAQELPEGMGDMEIERMDLEVEIEGEGTIHWDLAAGVPHSYELPGKLGMTMDMGFAISMGEQSLKIEQHLELSGSFTHELKIQKN